MIKKVYKTIGNGLKLGVRQGREAYEGGKDIVGEVVQHPTPKNVAELGTIVGVGAFVPFVGLSASAWYLNRRARKV